MIGERLVITDSHRACASKIIELILPRVTSSTRPLVVAITGESGSGKSETAACLCDLLEDGGLRTLRLSQDDYAKVPPRANDERRRRDPTWIGPGEVHLDLLDAHVRTLRDHPDDPLDKPLVFRDEDRIGEEIIHPLSPAVIVVEGTYTMLLDSADVRVLIDGVDRARSGDALRETVRGVERRVLATHRGKANIVIAAPMGTLERV
jgi:uridine kinase